MLTNATNGATARRVVEEIEVDEFVPRGPVPPGGDQQTQVERHAFDGYAAVSSRLLIRLLPIAFGILLGSIADNLAIGLVAAIAVSLSFDLSMEDGSIVRALYRYLRRA